MAKRVCLGLAAFIAVFVGVVAMRPNTFRVERSTSIDAPPSAVFGQVNEFRKWQTWSPWEKLDPAMKKSFEGPASGVGSIYAWDGNDQAGAGKLTILESRPDELVRIKLEFTRPMEDVCTTEFAFKPEGKQTRVTWVMSGEHTFLSKAVCMFMNMDKMIGGDFEEGLARMKKIAETPATQANAASDEPTAATISR
ncbi:MAG: polyketide cyclase [Planctomycetes bacterium SCN 63-9]|nr:MAG: polyketide cyclase [Planctomycetes bacterium SCN 63-9]